jgi:hypothetical protein
MNISVEGNIMSNVETTALETFFPAPLGHDAVVYWVPIAMRARVLAAYRAAGIPIRIRFRGPRTASVGRLMPRIPASAGFYRRTRNQANQDCLLADATHFSVYRRG